MNSKSASFLLFILLSLFSGAATAQEMILIVERCKALDQTSPIHNIWVDEENAKWVANSQGLYKVLALDLVQKVSIPTGMTSLLNLRGGNAKIEWNTLEMHDLIGSPSITCASYDPKSKTVWIGTHEYGAFQIALSPLRIMQRINVENRKLTSNQINDIFIQPSGTTWIATNDGMLVGSGDKWTLQERYLNFIGVDAWGQNLWILGDDFLWQVDSKGKWNAVAIEPKNVEGQLRDIAVDDEGRVWIASNMMTGYNAEQIRYQRFGPGQYFTSQFVNCLDVDQDGSIWTGTDDKGLYLIQWEAAMTVNILMDTPLDCRNKNATAALTAKITGGEPPYTFKWNSGQATDKINLLPAGHYFLTVTDSKGIVKTAKYEIPDPNLRITTELVTPSSGLPDGDGSVNLLVDGGNSPLKYAWDNGEARQTAVKLTTGVHSVTVTDANGCSSTATIAVPEKILPLTVFAKFLSSNTCADTKNGVAEIEVKGGKAPFRYIWNPNAGTESKVSNLSAGLYSVTVTDANGQTAATSVNIPAPPILQVSATQTGQATVNMPNGQAEAKVSGGTSPYSYAWDSGANTAVVKNFSGGLHTLTVTDANGCTTTTSVNITENVSAIGVIIKQPVKISCHGQGGGALKVEITGGKSPYTYHWSNGQTTVMAEKLSAGPYKVTVTDALGTTFLAEYTIEEPSAITVNIEIDAQATANNADGRATARASGGTGTLQYAWDNGEKTSKAVKLGAGAHTVTVTDGGGCSATSTINITESITSLVVTIEQLTQVKCYNTTEGSIKANVSGGKEPYTYFWSNRTGLPTLVNLDDGLYTLTVTDAAGQTATSVITVNSPPLLEVEVKSELAATLGKNDGRALATVTGGTGKYSYKWSNGETTAKAIAMNAGKHTILVTDENGCTATGEVTITENILPLATRILERNKIACAGQSTASLKAEITGGKPPYVYAWKGNGKEWREESVSALPAGTYTLSVTDGSGLSGSAVYEIKEPMPLQLAIDKITPATTNNEDGKVILRATGGTEDYSMEGLAIPAGTNTFTIDRLKPGDHLLIVHDAAGCSAQIRVTIPENIFPLTVNIEQTKQNLCVGDARADIEARVDGGKPPYQYNWSNGWKDYANQRLAAGTYTLTVTDAAGQNTKTEYTVKEPQPLLLMLSNIRAATNDRLQDGKANVESTGGTGSCTFLWSSGETTHQAVKLPLGPGTVVATDQNGCTAKADFEIREKVLPELTPGRIASGEPLRLEKIQFQADSINVNAEAIPSLDELYEFLYDNPTVIIEVAGHTNGLPADEYCDKISAERANAVANYIIRKGIEARRVIAKGYGKRKPIATNQTSEGRKKNQRVEIRLININE